MTPSEEPGVWVFNGDGGRFPSGVFTAFDKATLWVATHSLSGTLTWYPLDAGVYEWVMAKGYWQQTRDYQSTPAFIQNFSSAYTGHFHFVDGRQDGG